jgi:tetratricopeptide (TPR) repeat protein
LSAQNNDEKLAAQYMADKAYSKAADIYEDLAKKQPESIYYYENLLQCYIPLKDYKSGEKLIDKRIRKFEYSYSYQVDKGYIYGLQDLNQKRDEVFKKLLDIKIEDRQSIDNLANAFLKRKFYDHALAAYLKGRKSLKDEYLFAFEISEICFVKGDLAGGTNELVTYAGQLEFTPQ